MPANYRPNYNSLYSLHLGEKGGFDGNICKLMYLNRNVTADELTHIYLSGPLDLSSGCPNTNDVSTDGIYDTYSEPKSIFRL